MSVILFGVPGKLKQLLTRVPANNAAQIAKLDGTITSRAPADTAVSNAVLTPAKVGLLDNLDAAISTLETETSAGVRYSALETYGSRGAVKSIQKIDGQRVGTGYINVTINSVVNAKSIILETFGGVDGLHNAKLAPGTNTTTAVLYVSSGQFITLYSSAVVIEFY